MPPPSAQSFPWYSWGLFLVSDARCGGAALSPQVPACPPTAGAALWLLQGSQKRGIFGPFPGKRGLCFVSHSFCTFVKHRADMPKSSGSDTAARCQRGYAPGAVPQPVPPLWSIVNTARRPHAGAEETKAPKKLEIHMKHAPASRASLPPSHPPGTDTKSRLLPSLRALTQSPAHCQTPFRI